MQSLKVLVIVMGIAILAILTFIVFTVIDRVSGDGSLGGGTSAEFGEIELQVPAGCSIASAEGQDDMLIIRLDGLAERGCQQVLILDLGTGRILSRVKAVPSP